MKVFIRGLLIFALVTGLFAQQPAKGTTDEPSGPKKDPIENRDPAPTFNFFKLTFVIYELDDGKRINQRDYMMIGKTNNQPSSIRIGTRVPVYTEEKKMTYVDAGLTLRCGLKEQADRRLQAECDVEISSFIRPEQLSGANSAPSAPVLRTTRTSSWALLTLGKAAVIATVDDVNSAKRMQVEVTATKVD
ncbi:MAG TPA: hypothetical protein VN872_00945 [Candidatus Acidoferrum sp.]|nr:hypothetical protein [Candidatus Acidoferrum sp.]